MSPSLRGAAAGGPRAALPFLRGVLVAYGLSFSRAGSFPTEDPGVITPVDVRFFHNHGPWRDHEDLYAR
ncbi:MAG: hypothetical protein EDX89_17975 [Acidobacteria bacterium]|nr:MAG: hypothetical protein EDX89_17975 [Acidobacteriota bacterium]MCE7958304.1 hypothetical protein [Acidobacteria bacterium ACB2]